MSSKMVGHAIVDPNLKFPKKPRYLKELVSIPFQNKLLFHGSENLQILSGNAATDFLPKLLPVLDGTNSVEDILAMFPKYSPKDLTSILTLLFMRGLLDDAEGDEDVNSDCLQPEVRDYFKRNNDSTRVNRSALEGLERLTAANILLLTDSEHGEILFDEIKYMGASTIDMHPLEGRFDVKDRTLVVVFCTNSLNHEKLEEIDFLCKSHQVPWLLTRVEDNHGIIGPYFEDQETPPYESYRKKIEEVALVETKHPNELTDMWEYYTAIEVVYFITQLAPIVSGDEYLKFNFDDWTSTSKKLIYNSNVEFIASKFDDTIAFPSRHLITTKSHQMHYNPQNLLLANSGKVFPSAQLMDLPFNPVLHGSFLSNAFKKDEPLQPLNLESLTTLLTMTGGIKQSEATVKRWAPTGGNLGSPQLYVIPNTVEGLESSLYFYQDTNQTLANIGKANAKENGRDVILRVLGDQVSTAPDALIAITGNLENTAGKYNGFAYKIIHLDGGVALSQMQAISKGLDLELKIFFQWNEQSLIDFLGIDVFREPVIALAGIYGKGDV